MLDITKARLVDLGAPAPLIALFAFSFPEGTGSYQDVLTMLAGKDQVSEANWLMNKLGPDPSSVLRVPRLLGHRHFFVVGTLIAETDISIRGQLRAGCAIIAGRDIIVRESLRAGAGIKAGRLLRSGGDMKSGEDVQAGVRIEVCGGTEIEGNLTASGYIDIGHSLRVGGMVQTEDRLIVGWTATAGRGIKAKGGIREGGRWL